MLNHLYDWYFRESINIFLHFPSIPIRQSLLQSLSMQGKRKETWRRQSIVGYDIYLFLQNTVYPKKYAYGFVVLCFVVVMQSFIMNSHEVFIHIHQGCFGGTGAIVRLPQCRWSKPGGYGKISQCITTTKHSKAKTVSIFLGIYCTRVPVPKDGSNILLSTPSF